MAHGYCGTGSEMEQNKARSGPRVLARAVFFAKRLDLHTIPLHTAALAFVSFGIVLVQVQVLSSSSKMWGGGFRFKTLGL